MVDARDAVITDLREKLENATAELLQMKLSLAEKGLSWNEEEQTNLNQTYDYKTPKAQKTKLTNADIARYSRQLILPEVGVQGQLKLGNTSVLIVGAGGLGCPCALYLAAAGIACIGIVDYDGVEINNLHRQVLHSELKVNWSKVASTQDSLSKLNSSVQIIPYKLHLDSSNALDLIKKYNIVVDATDNVPTRYLLNDACVLAKKPLVSGSALRFDGQLTVYNYNNGPCYRCLYPRPPPPETVGNCSESGVLGVVPGVIGSLQALEVIKIAIDLPVTLSQKLLVFDALESMITTITLRGRQENCAVCGRQPSIHVLQDYEQFCGTQATDRITETQDIENADRISVQDYKRLIDEDRLHILVDVRPAVELEICQLPFTKYFFNIPIRELETSKNTTRFLIEQIQQMKAMDNQHGSISVIAVCHHGNDSQRAVVILKNMLKNYNVSVQDVKGGLSKWSAVIDTNFPKY